ncbi:homoserine dehydrogenase [Prosthecobacter fusiformis]|uniref:Homoserine dehydrogenase n=1 Tax=Prosthecobacter fusiformis TaxID=48464 RepID=A0A4R7SSB7_9BACT|nr:homoserine dehydrogenase [Prosthecobacter fusiformis]TDU81068.1 homoserine dehydrogenase [Prosthecobacter fusiformis]
MSVSIPPRTIYIGLAGLGNVGAGVFKNLEQNGDLIRQRTGADIQVKKVIVRDLSRARDVLVPEDMLSTRWQDLIEDPYIQVIVELIGGTTTAYDLVCAALRAKKIVVTGNKALLAERGQELFALAEQCGVPIYFEAAVAGGIPIIQVLQEGLVGNRILSIHGIINGTCNYILTRMSQAGLSYEAALGEAQEKGYAEADPTLDVSGWDAAHKAIILASLSYGFWIPTSCVHVEGVDKIDILDFKFAKRLGYTIKLLSVIRADQQGLVEVRTQPTLVPLSHVLANVSGSFNALLVNGDIVGETLFYGRGAGQDPTSSSVISDLCEAAAVLMYGSRHSGFVPHGLYGKSKPIEDTVSHYYLRLTVDDVPGVLAQVATVLGQRNIGISSMIQPEDLEDTSGSTSLVLMLHDALLSDMLQALDALKALTCVRGNPSWMRVETLQG